MARKFVVKGQSMTMRQAEKVYGISPYQVRRLAAYFETSMQHIYDSPDVWDMNIKTVWEDPPYAICGEIYNNFEEVAAACFMDVQSLRDKLNRQYAGRVTFGMIDLQTWDYFTFKYQGVDYASVPGIIGYHYMQITDVIPAQSLTAAKKQLELGKTVEETLEYLKSRDTTRVVDGVTYKSQSAFLRTLGVTQATFNERVEKLGSEEDAIAYYRAKREQEKNLPVYKVGNIECKTQREVYDALGLSINYTTFNDYVRIHGMQGAIAHYKETGGKSQRSTIERYTVGDRTNLGIKEACELAHTAATTVRKRSKETGKTVQTLLDESYTEWLKDPAPYLFEDVAYRNQTEVARALGIGLPALTKVCATGLKTVEAAKVIRQRQLEGRLREDKRSLAQSLGITVSLYDSMMEKLETHEAIVAYIKKYPKVFERARATRWDTAPIYDCVIDGTRYYIAEDIVAALGISLAAFHSYRSEHSDLPMSAIIDHYRNAVPRRVLVSDVTIGGVPCSTYRECASLLGVSLDTVKNISARMGLRLAVQELLKRPGCAEAVEVTTKSKGLSDFIRVEYGLYLATCETCNRRLLLKDSECLYFRHDDASCSDLFWEEVTGSNDKETSV